jgi:hypothetical protein
MCLEFGPVNSTIQKFWENRIKIICEYGMKGSKKSDWEVLNQVTLVSRFRNREVALSQWAVLFWW